jgi:hydroxycarboxylate dehydrogenase B
VPTLTVDPALAFAEAMFIAAKVPAEEANIVARSLVDANLCGFDSHGLIRVVQYIDLLEKGVYRAGAAFTVLNETPAILVADANYGLGQVQAHLLLRRLMEKARQLGVASGSLRNCAHIGRLGEYAETAAAERMVFFGTVNSHGHGRRVAPPGGIEGRISTNPLCMGVPTASDPVVLDIGTSVCAEGKVRVHFNKKQPVPEGWLLDAQGKPTTDPASLYAKPQGTILPLGGAQAYKGFGLGLMLDMFAGGLSGGMCSNPAAPLFGCNAVLFTVYDIRQFGGTEHFLREVTGLAEFVRGCPRAEGVSEIMLPGDPERKQRAKRQAEGIALDDGTWGQLMDAAKRLNVPVPGTK